MQLPSVRKIVLGARLLLYSVLLFIIKFPQICDIYSFTKTHGDKWEDIVVVVATAAGVRPPPPMPLAARCYGYAPSTQQRTHQTERLSFRPPSVHPCAPCARGRRPEFCWPLCAAPDRPCRCPALRPPWVGVGNRPKKRWKWIRAKFRQILSSEASLRSYLFGNFINVHLLLLVLALRGRLSGHVTTEAGLYTGRGVSQLCKRKKREKEKNTKINTQ